MAKAANTNYDNQVAERIFVPSKFSESLIQWIEKQADTLAAGTPLPTNTKGLSQSRFSALIQKHLGISPINYFHRQQIEYAQTLLSNENISVKETAARLDFDDQLAFSAHIKRLVCVSQKILRGK